MSQWTIQQLVRGVEKALELAPEIQPASARVRPAPDERTIRYYTTLGLLDRPATMRGRTALYGERHLLQLVAIKRLQGQGCPLTQVQRLLAGADEARLRQVAKLPTENVEALLDAEPEPASTDEPAEPPPLRENFWMALPPLAPSPRAAEPTPARSALAPALCLRLGDEATLVLHGVAGDALPEAAVAELQAAAVQFLDVLRRWAPRDATDDSVDGRAPTKQRDKESAP